MNVKYTTVTQVKYADKKLLQLINKISTGLGYNRLLDSEFLDNLDSDTIYYVTYSFIHEHIAGKPSEPHIRCVFVDGSRGSYILDMPNYCFELLPKQEIGHGLK